jgi:hypothetical protein
VSEGALMLRPLVDTRALTEGGVPRNLLRDVVFSRLLLGILRGDHRRGERLRLEAIAADMRVSRTPVREALVPLETLGLVSVRRYVGVVIAHWDVSQMIERVEILANLLDGARADLDGVDGLGADPGRTDPGGESGTGSVNGRTDGRADGGWADGGRLDVARAERTSADPPVSFEPAMLRGCMSEGGMLALIAEWCLHRVGRSVSAEWVVAQRAVLDVFFTDDVARAQGIDVARDRGNRVELLADARSAAERDDVSVALDRVRAHAAALAVVREPFVHRPSR